MVRGRSITQISTVVCCLLVFWAIRPGISMWTREGILTVAAGLWLLGVGIKRSRLHSNDLMQIGGMMTVGIILWNIGDVRMPATIWGAQAGRDAVCHLFAVTLGLISAPALMFFYIITPSRPTRARTLQTAFARPASASDTREYKVAI